MIPYLHTDKNSVTWEGRVVSTIDTRGEGKLEDKKENIPNAPGFYVKVRFYEYHTEDVIKLRDEQLPWIEVAGTVLGSGRSGGGATPNILPGDHVYGLWIGSRPVIIGVKLNDPDPKTTLPTNQGLNGLRGFTTYRNGDFRVASYSIPGKTISLPPENSWKANWFSLSTEQQADPKSYAKLACPNPGKPTNATGMTSKISDTIKKIENLERSVQKYEAIALKYISDKEAKAQEWIQKASEWMNGKIDWLMKEIQKRVIGAINAASAAASTAVPINTRWTLREAQSIIVEALICLFKKMMSAIAGLMERIMKEIVNRFINSPLCAIENFLRSLLANVIGMLSSAVSGLAGALKGVISNVSGFVSSVLGIIKNVLKLFECELETEDNPVKEWHIMDGANIQNANIFLDIEGIIRDSKGLADQFKNIVNPDTLDINAALINFSGIFSSLTCNTSPVPCGPPIAQFFGGGGQGTLGNAIISAAGEILGVDIIKPGFNYTSAPSVSFIDACGKGFAANAIAVMGPVPTVTIKAIGPDSDGFYYLTWKSKNAIRAVTNFGTTDLNGHQKVKPLETTTYSITVFDQNDFPADDSITITPGVSVPEGQFVEGNIDVLDDLFVEDPIAVGVIEVIMENPGYGYLSQSDGSLGGDGRTWSESDETIVRRYEPLSGDGFSGFEVGDPQLVPILGAGNRPDLYVYDQPYPPGFPIDLGPGDLILTPATSSEISVGGQEILPGVPTLIANGGSVSAPFPTQNLISITDGSPKLDDGKYPVMLKICRVQIQNPGVNYSINDTIEVVPSNGAILRPIIGPFGTIAKVEVVNSGMGFTEYPEIRIISETGYNAVLLPHLCVNNVGDLSDEERDALAKQGQILQVVDCVGKV